MLKNPKKCLFLKWILVYSSCFIAFLGCQTSTKPDNGLKTTLIQIEEAPMNSQTLIPYQFSPNSITEKCNQALEKVQKEVALLKEIPPNKRTLSNTLLHFENLFAEFSETTTPLIFMASVSTDKATRDEANQCEEKLGNYYPTLLSDRKLYQVLKSAQAITKADKKLKKETLLGFEKSGMKLNDKDLAEVTKLKQELSKLQTEFNQNLNEDKSSVTFTKEELKGLTENQLSQIKKEGSKFIATTKTTDYILVMENAENSETRRKMLYAYVNKVAQKNTALMEQAIALRQKIAKKLGYKTWAHLQIDGRMAKNPDQVLKFLEEIKTKVKARNKSDLAEVLAEKKARTKETTLNSWDIPYYTNQIKKARYNLDDEKISEYFPSEKVLNGVFELYSDLFGVQFKENKKANTWAKGVKQYDVFEGEKYLSTFFADTAPREGKYGHAAAFTLKQGRKVNGKYNGPISSIVSNFTPPNGDKPSLLTHDEVETLFHEFGHIMHQILTQAPYASLSGTSVAQDFVEAPSQMLENWAWDKNILKSISAHYKTGEALPDSLIENIRKTRGFNKGYFYTRQLTFAFFDLKIHSLSKATSLDVTKVFNELSYELSGIKPIEGGHFPAGFGHLMGGYDAGYYGYLWSEVYAQDLFSEFERTGLKNARTGMKYRRAILESGNMEDASALMRKFLGRKPSAKAFNQMLQSK